MLLNNISKNFENLNPDDLHQGELFNSLPNGESGSFEVQNDIIHPLLPEFLDENFDPSLLPVFDFNINQEILDAYAKKLIPPVKLELNFLLFPIQYDCAKACTQSPCFTHYCQECSKSVGSMNALVCNTCLKAYHITCLSLPMTNLYDRIWYCELCYDKLSEAQKKVRDSYVGNGYCTGKIDSVLSGTGYKFRLQMNVNNLHRPTMAGIHGSARCPAYSLVLSGGYPFDEDQGNDFYYTGAGGVTKQGVQLKDQDLSSTNLSLAATCDTFLSYEGGMASDWTKSSPVRVIRGNRLKKLNSQYAPEVGFRYDGIYKLVRYWAQYVKGSNYIIWRFHFRRDDLEPAPWSEEGKKWIQKMNIEFHDIEVPTTYKKQISQRKALSSSIDFKKVTYPNNINIIKKPNLSKKQKKAKSHKKSKDFKPVLPMFQRANMAIISKPSVSTGITFEINKISFNLQNIEDLPKNSFKLETIYPGLIPFLKVDFLNFRIWGKILKENFQTIDLLHTRIQIEFECTLCKYVVNPYSPTTLPCHHTFCFQCLRTYIESKNFKCPKCHKDLVIALLGKHKLKTNQLIEKTLKAIQINSHLSIILLALLPFLKS